MAHQQYAGEEYSASSTHLELTQFAASIHSTEPPEYTEEPTRYTDNAQSVEPVEPAHYSEPYTTPLLSGAAHVPQGWPISPSPIRSSVFSIVADLIVDVILLSLSVAFFAFGLTVRSYDQTPTEANPRTTNTLLQATKYGPSVFPILFACVVGRAAHAILIWRLERGARVGTLDLLAGSTSLTSTVTSQFQMRTISFLGLILVAIWALSPIGGQASFRQMTIGPKVSTETTNFTYMIPNGNLAQYDSSERNTYFSIINSLFISSLISPDSTKQSAVDTWGNVKVPLIETYENSSTPDSQGWFTTGDSNITYSSLVGLPVSGFGGNFIKHSVSMEAQYLYLNCPVVYGLWFNISTIDAGLSFIGPGAEMWSLDDSLERMQIASTDPAKMARPRWFSYQWWDSPTNMTSNCSITTTYVEVDVECGGSATCAVSRLRRSRLAHPPAAFTLMDTWAQSWGTFGHNFVNSMAGHPAYGTAVQFYLLNPSNPLAGYSNSDYGTDSHPTNDVYAARLGQLVNTYWTCINGMHAVPGGMTPETAYMEGTNLSSPANFLANSSISVGTRSTSTPVIKCDYGWVVALSIASMVLVLASLVHPIVRFFFTTAPDLMLNVSSLAMRDNPYVALPANGTFLAASDRARLLKKMKVRFGDVDGASEVGVLAIASLDPPGVKNVENVRKLRLYS
ncbi:hypothetical protein F5Y13DRAFT_191584 [Hypoxylon sp. FL1857]|nr:hypothetical protein F5Y13DRAFT_191584 [Hypoxylon sp. FL1857]